MCGIVAYLGKKVAQPILTEGLKRLEYRGYDSAGVALLGSGSIRITKSSGRISALEQILEEPDAAETFGIGHTRWATHGEPNTVNAHPHLDHSGKIALVHNGIIENYATLKTWLRNEGVEFASDTDTEVIANLIGYFYAKSGEDQGQAPPDGQNKFEWAVQKALREVHGTYGLAIACSDFPGMLIGAKLGSPLRPLLSSIRLRRFTWPTTRWLPSTLTASTPRRLTTSPSARTSRRSSSRWSRSSWPGSSTTCSRRYSNSPTH
ncbi:MAG: hypothetical protein ACYTE3_08630 [Planctomycetota bacterium]